MIPMRFLPISNRMLLVCNMVVEAKVYLFTVIFPYTVPGYVHTAERWLSDP